jgi:DeoR family suf operon transcriptional repressor
MLSGGVFAAASWLMANTSVTSDSGLLDLLRQQGPLGVSALAVATKVTPTAVRQRLTRLMEQGLIARELFRAGRGRPSHRYLLTARGQRSSGHNFADLATVLWQEVRAVKDAEVRRGLFQRLAKGLAGLYARQVEGTTPEERMQSVAALFSERDVPLIVEHGLPAATNQEDGSASRKRERPEELRPSEQTVAASPAPAASQALPVLTALACPYPELADQDRGVCAMERMLFSELIGTNLRLAECRLDGDQCCRFAMN